MFDGDCRFCRLWVGYWQSQTGSRVEFAPWQSALVRFPEVPERDCRQAVQFVGPEGRVSGAHAVFAILALMARYRWLLCLYRHAPGFRAVTEWGYRVVAAHRNAGYRVTRMLWGQHVAPSTYDRPVAWFRRGLAAVYVFAFASFGMQARGLIGEKGILPVELYLRTALVQMGDAARWRVPTLFWWGHSDYLILTVAWGGVAIGLVALLARSHSRWYPPLFSLLFVYYLSLVSAGQIFMSFQWDYLLLEAGFLGIFLRPSRGRVWLVHWLLFRLMLESGLAKLSSHDPVWRNLTALAFHYQTQPLPTPLAWYAHQLPLWFQQVSAAAMFAVELVTPFLIFGPRKMKQTAAFAIAGLQLGIAATGNYTFFNLLTLVLCIPLFDDACWRGKVAAIQAKPARLWLSVALVSAVLVLSLLGPRPEIAQFGIVNRYGLFATMTTRRDEIRIEGSLDGERWEPYIFRDKPGPLNRRPSWVAPFQPRLDWQMWFAALGTIRENPWFAQLAVGLLQGSEPVKALFEVTPFGTRPKYVRAMVEEYRFTTWAERSKTGNWWKAEPRGVYLPPVSLRPQ